MQVDETARDFIARYEKFWQDGARDVPSVYATNAILCGYEIVKSRDGIGALLGAIHGQGWIRISIEIVEMASAGDTILLACRYTAHGAKDELTAKSSYVLVQIDGIWKAVMHTAT